VKSGGKTDGETRPFSFAPWINTFRMIILCPFCGNKLKNKLQDGISSCDYCQRIFDSSSYHKILSALWISRNWHVHDLEIIQRHCELTAPEAAVVDKYVLQLDYTFDELVAAMKEIEYNFCKVA
jgi:hypothetical protein